MSRPIARALLVLALACAPFARAEEPAAPPPLATAPTLTLEACIARALQKNFDLKIETFSTDIAREAFKAADASFEPVFSATAKKQVVQSSLRLNNDRTDTTNVLLGVSELVPTGATFEVSTALARYGESNGVDPNRFIFDPYYNSDVVLSVSQPLLRGFGPAVDRALIARSQLGVKIANLNFRSRVLQVVRDTEAAYYNLVFARENLVVKKHSLDLAQQLYDENKTRKLTGVATDLDVLSAEVGVANARNGIVLADQAVRNSEDALHALIGQFEFDSELGTVALLPYQEPSPSFDLSYKLARENQPDYLAAQESIKQLQIDVTTAKNATLPTLNLDGTAGFTGTGRTYDRATNNITSGDAHNWELDLTFSVPWGLHADRARYRSALASLRQQQTRLRQLDQNLLIQVRADVRAVETDQQSVEINAKATELATRQYELELARFKAGLSTSRQVLQTQDDLEAARVNELLARVDLRVAIANLHQLESSSLERYHINLAE